MPASRLRQGKDLPFLLRDLFGTLAEVYKNESMSVYWTKTFVFETSEQILIKSVSVDHINTYCWNLVLVVRGPVKAFRAGAYLGLGRLGSCLGR